ncbi:cupin domain-containing protein [Occultella gossypii]|uniref:Cupin domain-containing protein n=1 Tax=Occultella gossypii TaxID=2800820 RepID=A0ABS7SCQ9_9MICO|nr:cupin domain-containing protein [Occultella gossypii]MBZ2198151.1 cupin domain-containing protein [Occultella gossypii]
MSGAAPVIRKLADTPAFLIGPEDTVKLAYLAGPKDGTNTSVFLEVWEPGGAQPLNSHEESAEIFIVLKGQAQAHSDEDVVSLAAGDVLILQEGSEHRIINTSETEDLYTITIMSNDGGFAKLVTDGTEVTLTEADRAVLCAGLPQVV